LSYSGAAANIQAITKMNPKAKIIRDASFGLRMANGNSVCAPFWFNQGCVEGRRKPAQQRIPLEKV
jgi:hypothetical protein